MKNGMLVADSDMHIFEPPDLWQRYIDPAYRHAAPVGLTEMRRDMRVKVKSHVILRMGAVRPVDPSRRRRLEVDARHAYAHAEARSWDPTSQREAMDAEGLDVAVLFPTRGLFVLGLDTPQQMGHRRPRARLRRRHRARLQRLDARLLRRVSGAHVRLRHGRAARRRPRGRRGAALRRAARLQGDLPRARRGQPPPVARPRTTIRCGPSASGSTCRSASTAAARTSSSPTSPSRCSTS